MADLSDQILAHVQQAHLPAAQAQGAGPQARRRHAAVRRLPPRAARARPRRAASSSARTTPSAPAAAARHRHRHLPPHLHRRRLRPAAARRGQGRPPRSASARSDALDAATGDVVLVRITRKPNRPDVSPAGEIVRVLERATRQFVGTYFERDGEGYVRVDGTVFSHSIYVGDPGAKGARPDDKVVFEMVRFPSPEDRGEGVITEVLGPRGQPGVDTLSIIRAYNLPDEFPEDALEEARDAADAFREDDLDGREDFTGDLVVTIDPVDARDFDDAVSLTRDPETGHWQLARPHRRRGPLRPARRRRSTARPASAATSVYLPQRVIPMFPELISNHLASLQQGRRALRQERHHRLHARRASRPAVRFANGAIRVAPALHLRTGDGASSSAETPPRRRGGRRRRSTRCCCGCATWR